MCLKKKILSDINLKKNIKEVRSFANLKITISSRKKRKRKKESRIKYMLKKYDFVSH